MSRFKDTVDRGSAVNFGADSGFACLDARSWVQNETWIIDLSQP